MTKPPGGRLLRKSRLRKKYSIELRKRCFKAIDWVAELYKTRFGLVDFVFGDTIYRDCRLESIRLMSKDSVETPLEVRDE